ncbi:MAG TPA: nucleoside kinase [Firmicutes bacterium]|nr:nucleoside kinase [Bacillota bacterium]
MKEWLEKMEKKGKVVGFLKNNEIFSLLEKSEAGNGEGTSPIYLDTKEGHAIYEKSMVLLFAAAVKALYPHAEVHVEHTIDTGLYFTLTDRSFPLLKMEHVAKIKEKMDEMIREGLPFVLYKGLPRKEMLKKLRREENEDKVELYKQLECQSLVTLDEKVYDYGFFKTVPSTSYLQVFDLLYYPPGLIIRMPLIDDHTQLAPFREQKKLFRIHQEFKQWAEILNMEFVASLNDLIEQEKHREMILVSEALQEKQIIQIAGEIVKMSEHSRLILIAGPSSSGKTTFSKKLATYIKTWGISPVAIGMDDFFLPWDRTPRTEKGEMDFECVETIDLDLFNEQLILLMEGHEVTLPKYDFLTGTRGEGKKLKLSPSQPIVIEGIHALNPKLTEAIPDNLKFKVYVSALTQLNMDYYNRIKTTDVRLVRRMVRDAQFRGHSALDTLKMWGKVRAGEDKYIFPYQETADVMFNSSLPYELCILKPFALKLLKEVPREAPEYLKVWELTMILSLIHELDPYYTPKTSIIREFVGNSLYEY